MQKEAKRGGGGGTEVPSQGHLGPNNGTRGVQGWGSGDHCVAMVSEGVCTVVIMGSQAAAVPLTSLGGCSLTLCLAG